MHAFVLLALAAHPVWDADVFSNPQGWKQLETGDVAIDSRPIKDSPYFEYRATLETTSSVDTLCSAVFEWGTKGADSPGLKSAKILRDGDDERVVYHQIEQALVSNRDYAMTVMRQRDETSCRIRFKATNELAPELGKGVVRMNNMWGSWAFVPSPKGTRITYTLFADPAGSVPPFLVHGSQKSAARASVIKAVEKAHALETK